MTREPNPYAKEPALTTNAAMLMAVPSVVAEDVLDGPDVVDAQHQKNADIHVSSTDREKWDKAANVANSASQQVRYSSLEYNDEAEDVMLAGFLWFPYSLDQEGSYLTAKGYTSLSIRCGNATEDADGNPLDMDTWYTLRVWDMEGNMICESLSDNPYRPGEMMYFDFAALPETDSDMGPFILEFVSGDNYSATEPVLSSPVCVRAIRDYYEDDLIIGLDVVTGSEECMRLIYTMYSSYNHFYDKSEHLTVEDRSKLNKISYIESQTDKLKFIDSYGSAGDTKPANTNSQYASTAIGNGATTTGQYATAVGYNAKADSAIATASAGCTVAVGYSAEAIGYGAVALGYNTTAAANGTALGRDANASGDYSIAIGANAYNKDAGTILLRTTTQAVFPGTNNNQPLYTYFYIIGAGSDLANTYEDGYAAIGYVVKDSRSNILEAGTRKLSELLTNNTTFAPASLDPDAEPPKVFMPTGILDPDPEPKQIEEPEETPEKTETPFEKLKAKFAELLKNNKE